MMTMHNAHRTPELIHTRLLDLETFAQGVCAVLCMDLSQMPEQQGDGNGLLEFKLQL